MYTLGSAFAVLLVAAGLLVTSVARPPARTKMTRVTIQAQNCQSGDAGVTHNENITVCVSNPSFIERAKKLAITGDTASLCMRLLPGTGCDREYQWTVDPKKVFFADFLAAVWGMYCPKDVSKQPKGWLPPAGKGPARNGLLCLPTARILSVQ